MFRLFYLLLTLTVFFSCTTTEDPYKKESELSPKPISQFLSHDIIVKEMNTLSATGEQITINEGYKKRLANLIPKEKFLLGIDKLIPSKRRLQEATTLTSIDLRFRDTPIKEQIGPRCTAWATSGAMENQLNVEKIIPDLDISDMHLWSKYNEYSTELAIESAAKYKICSESEYPGDGKKSSNCEKNAKYQITSYNYLGESPDLAANALMRGNAVVIAMSTPNGLLNCDAVVKPTTTASDGGHAIALVGFQVDSTVKGGGYFIFKNSWGTECGDKGYQYVPLHALCPKSGFYCYFWELVTVAPHTITPPNPPTPSPDPTPIPVPDDPKCVEWKRVWYMPWRWYCSKYE